jgi:predicted protein tyrosine phosphatase
MIVEVMNRQQAKRESFKQERMITSIVSITDCDKLMNHFNNAGWIRGVLHLSFDDVERGEPNCMIEWDAIQIAQWVNMVKDKVERIIVHCEAGVSRSAGVAAAIMKFLNGDDMPIFQNGRFCPNMTCYRLTLNALMDSVSDDEISDKEQINIAAWREANDM